MAGGRPTTYTPALGLAICDRMAVGELCVDICDIEGMPAFSTLHQWKRKHPEFAEAYARAREDQAHAVAERAVRSGRGAKGAEAAAARVQFDADRWLASRLDPRAYGDRVTAEHTGPDGKALPAPVAVTIVRFGGDDGKGDK